MLAGPDPRRTPPVFCSLDQWCGSNANFIAIWGSSVSDIWIIAERTGDLAGTKETGNPDDNTALLHWDGAAWRAIQIDETRRLRAIWGSARNDIWAAGSGPSLLHFDGESWSLVVEPIIPAGGITAISGSSANDVWAVGWNRAILHFDGVAWSSIELSTWDTFRSVSSSADEVWVLGDKTLNHFDRTSWSTVARPSESALGSVWGRADREAWVAGQSGTLERWNSTVEQTNAVTVQASTADFRSLWGNSGRDGWAVGEQGLIAHWNSTAWTAGPHLTDFNLNAAWGFEGSTWFVGDNGTFLEFDGQNWLSSPIAGHQLNRLWGSHPADVWAAGREIVHWDGKLWTDVPRPGSDEVFALWGSGEADVWAAGTHGLLLHWDGLSWQVSASPTSADIKGVWGSSSRDVWAVDSDGHFLHFGGSSWSIWSASSFGPLASVWGRNAADVIAVGGSNRIHFDGSEWSLLPPHPSETPTYELAFGNAQLVWIGGNVGWSAYKAGGTRPELGHWDGIGMSDNLEPKIAPPNVSLNYSSVEAGWADNERDVWIYLSRVLHWDGAQWSYSAVGGPTTINALWGTTSDLWALTGNGQILAKSR